MTAGDGVTLGRHVGRQRSARAARCTATASLRHPVAAVPLSVVVLCDLQGVPYETAASVGCAVGTIRSRLHRARRLLATKVRRADGAHGVARAVMVCGMTSHDDHLAALVDALRDAESGDAAPAHVEAAVMRAWDASHAVHTPARLSTVSQFASLAAGAVIATGLTLLGGHLRFATAVRRPRRGDDNRHPGWRADSRRRARSPCPYADAGGGAARPRCAVNCVLEWRCRR